MTKKKAGKSILKSKVVSKRILKKQKPMTINLKKKEVESILDDPNRFFIH